ncbi:Tetratricopeptide TPR_1 repeat-containing protein [Bacteroides coprosuis DSM 18011]|uniref:Tetratricopeptide TPR_1 repeat-containing protein n=1 Tax=Bacteroides coprosuis DSM 18011 TaxID=679937 RepID=F3ZUH5_9BACE|nr:DUF3868 domain-containing protein [Bacteroides coprosuis]EGJ72423.1 Tetratricopeptide TPR_1 repeat-containing protein [Bacteroides coprosuis DSM 18011]HJD92588.1 DUF3868 domain-containing protein [Bacteroides coprosuis]
MKKFLYITLLLLGVAGFSNAQTVLDGKAEVSNVEINRDGKQLKISMDVNATPAVLKSNEELQLTPRLTGVNTHKDLPTIIVAGRKSMIYRERNPQYFQEENNQLVVRKDKKNPQVINYVTYTDFEPWMNGADLELVENACGCSTTLLTSNEHKLDRFLLPPVVLKPLLSYVEPAVEKQKNRSIEASAYLDFPINQYTIRPEYRNNNAELSKIKESINRIIEDGDINVSSIKLTGHASPEGSYAGNERLARLRTDALRKYLISVFPKVQPGIFAADYVAENWDGLVKMLNESTSFSYKEDVMNIINSTTDLDSRERKIRALDGGKAFKTLLSDFFPALRNTNYEVKYIVRDFTPEEAKEIVWSKPQKLSLEEIYSVTKLYPSDSKEYGELFEIAVRMYPTDVIANLNASTNALLVKDTDKAKLYLDRLSDAKKDGVYYNNLGVYYLLTEQYTQAEDNFNKAIALESANAKENLDILKAKVEEIQLMKR